MKILQICHRVPFPPVDGGNIAMMNMAESIQGTGNEVFMFALNTNKHFVNPDTLPGFMKSKFHFMESGINTSVTLSGVLMNIINKDSYNVSRFYSQQAENAIGQILEKNSFDIVQLETLFTTPYIDIIRKKSKAKIVLRAHNVEHLIWERLSEKQTNPIKKRYFRFLAARLLDFELGILNKIDALVPITKVDEGKFLELGFDKPVLSLPLGIDLNKYPIVTNPTKPLSLFHLGSMDWIPNLEAVEWFLKNCWPTVNMEFTDLKLFLAGRNFPEQLMNAGNPNVICQGRIDDAISYMSDKDIMIVPLLSGSGLRVKIIEGLALGKTIISTSIGAEGINCTHGKNILIADTAGDFINQIRFCMNNPEQCRKIGSEGRVLAEKYFSNEAIGKKLTEFYFQLLQKVEVIA